MLLVLPTLVCVTKNKNYFIIQCYGLLTGFPLQQMLHGRSLLLRLYIHCLSFSLYIAKYRKNYDLITIFQFIKIGKFV